MLTHLSLHKGMLVGPAIGGLLSEPVSQYPNVDFGIWEDMLTKYPFVLPNIVGAFFCILSSIQIAISVEETLPPERYRSPKYIIPDVLQYLANLTRRLAGNSNNNNNEYENIGSTTTEEPTDEDSEAVSIEEDLKIIGAHFGEVGDAVCMASRSSRASFTAALHRPSTLASTSISTKTLGCIEEGESGGRAASKGTISSHFSHNILSLMQDDRVRECLWSYWVTTMASTSASGKEFSSLTFMYAYQNIF